MSVHEGRFDRVALAALKGGFGVFLVALGGEQEREERQKRAVVVAATFAALAGMRCTLRDWNGAVVGSGMVTAGGAPLRVPADEPVFCVELKR